MSERPDLTADDEREDFVPTLATIHVEKYAETDDEREAVKVADEIAAEDEEAVIPEDEVVAPDAFDDPDKIDWRERAGRAPSRMAKIPKLPPPPPTPPHVAALRDEQRLKDEEQEARDAARRRTPEAIREAVREAVEQRRADMRAEYAWRYADANAMRDAQRPVVVDEARMFRLLRDLLREGYTVTEIEIERVARQDGTVMVVGEPFRRPGPRSGWDWEACFQGDMILTEEAVALLIEHEFTGRVAEVRRVVKLKRPTDAEKALRDEVLAFVARLPQGRGNRKPVADYFEVDVDTVTRWRRSKKLRDPA